ncbi:MAG: T9SS type A sorting domain-containing protein [Chloroflexota bacterium]
MKFFTSFLLIIISTNSAFSQIPEPSWRFYRPGNTGIQGDNVTALWVDNEGNPYIAANTGVWGEGGIAKFNYNDNTWTNYSNVDYPVLGSFDNNEVQILDIVEDYENNLWMGTFKGALKFNPETGISSVISFGPQNSQLLGFTYDIDVAPDSSVWFISDRLVRYNPQTNEWVSWNSSNARVAIQPKTDGSYIVWSADTYYGIVITYNSATNQLSSYTPEDQGEIAGLPGKDCVDEAGNMWALRMSTGGNWETLEYQRPDGSWVNPAPPYENASYYIDAFKAYGNEKALLALTNGEVWSFNGSSWINFGIWRPDYATTSLDIDQQGNVWACGVGGAARRDAVSGQWQRYRITNTSQIDYFVSDLSIDNEGNAWFTGNAGTGVGGFQKFDGTRWTGFNEYTYGLGYPFPYQADNTESIYSRPSSGHVVFNPIFNGIHAWDGTSYYSLENFLTTSKGFAEDSNGRLWSLGEYYNLRYYDENTFEWITLPIIGSANRIMADPSGQGIWVATDAEIQRTDGVNTFSRLLTDLPTTSNWFTGLAADSAGNAWIGTWSQNTQSGSMLFKIDGNSGLYQSWSYDDGWPFPGEHVRPFLVSPDGKVWMQYDSEYPSTESGLFWFDGTQVGVFPSSPGGVPAWGVLPNSSIKDIELKKITNGYELWISCLGRGIAVLSFYTSTVDVHDIAFNPDISITAFPNPANEKVDIGFNVAAKGTVQIAVYNINGQKVKDMVNSQFSNGSQNITWDLTNQSGAKVGDGIYFARIVNADYTGSAKIIVRK